MNKEVRKFATVRVKGCQYRKGDYDYHIMVLVELKGQVLTLSVERGLLEHIPASWIMPILDSVLGEKWRKLADNLHKQRKNRWEVYFTGPWSNSYELVEESDPPDFKPTLITYIHLKGDELDFYKEAWNLGDIAPVLAEIEKKFGDAYDIEIEVTDSPLGYVYHEPGEPSGLLEKLVYLEEEAK